VKRTGKVHRQLGELNPMFANSSSGLTYRNYHQEVPCFFKSRISALVNYMVQVAQCKYRCHFFLVLQAVEDSCSTKHNSNLHVTNFSTHIVGRILAH